jgi:hypothetical protein
MPTTPTTQVLFFDGADDLDAAGAMVQREARRVDAGDVVA